MDELLVDAGNQRSKYYSHVGYLPRALFDLYRDLLINVAFQAEGPDAFSQFHLYVCSAFLVRWSEKLRKMDFQVSPNHRLQIIFSSIKNIGHYHVPAVVTHTGLGGPRD